MLEAAVVGVDHGSLVKTRAFVVLKQSADACQAPGDELKTFVEGKLSPHMSPRDIVFVADLPKTATGKIQRFELREQLKG